MGGLFKSIIPTPTECLSFRRHKVKLTAGAPGGLARLRASNVNKGIHMIGRYVDLHTTKESTYRRIT